MYKLLISVVAFLACASSIKAQSQTIYDTAKGNGDFSTLATALELTDLDTLLDCTHVFCSYTAFAPTDAAFGDLPDGLLEKLITEDWKGHLRGILLYHVAYRIYKAQDIRDEGRIRTILSEKLNTTIEGDAVKINDAEVIIPDIEARNGVIHAIDKVLIPSFMTKDIITTAREAGIFDTLLAAVDAAGLTNTLQGDGPFTLFAPTDDAFDKLGEAGIQALLDDIPTLADILKYHVINNNIVLSEELEGDTSLATFQGEGIDVNEWGSWFFKYVYLNDGVHIIGTDILTSNGVIHIIDEVLLPSSASPPEPTIKDILEADSNFETLLAALTAADLLETLNGDDKFTLFAPSDAAFDELGAETIAALLADKTGLAEILAYHLVSGEVMRSDLEDGAVETVNGANLIIDVRWWRRVFINNDIRVTHFDQEASNGVIHTIDKVLLPPGGDCLSVAKANGLDSFVAAVDQAGLGDALSDPNGSFTIFAPKNSAFDALAGVTLTDETLATVLKYHVLLETATEADLSDGDSLTTLQGSSIDVDFTYIYWFIFDRILLDDNAKIVESDLVCTNGIIHVIDEVLLPPGVSL